MTSPPASRTPVEGGTLKPSSRRGRDVWRWSSPSPRTSNRRVGPAWWREVQVEAARWRSSPDKQTPETEGAPRLWITDAGRLAQGDKCVSPDGRLTSKMPPSPYHDPPPTARR